MDETNIRVLSLGRMEGKNVLTNVGTIDNRILTGENKLRAFMEPNGLWSLKYEFGAVPEPLRQQFTSFSALNKVVKEYYHKRNIEVKEVIRE